MAIQAEYWQWLHFADDPVAEQWNSGTKSFSPIRPFREWVTGLFGRAWLKLDAAKDWQIEAEEVRFTDQFPQLASTDLGYGMMEAADTRRSMLIPYVERAWIRSNAYLLEREQMELIRNARAPMAAGRSGHLADWQSVVIPGAKWVVTGDAGTNSVSVKLTPIPRWITAGGALGDDFFLLPLDGSKGWKFGEAGGKTVAAR